MQADATALRTLRARRGARRAHPDRPRLISRAQQEAAGADDAALAALGRLERAPRGGSPGGARAWTGRRGRHAARASSSPSPRRRSFPIGLARRAEPDPGFHVDRWRALVGVGDAAVLVALVAGWPLWRVRRRPRRQPASAGSADGARPRRTSGAPHPGGHRARPSPSGTPGPTGSHRRRSAPCSASSGCSPRSCSARASTASRPTPSSTGGDGTPTSRAPTSRISVRTRP